MANLFTQKEEDTFQQAIYQMSRCSYGVDRDGAKKLKLGI